MNEFYYGSTLLCPISKAIGMPLDQVNFIFAQAVAFLTGYPFRSSFSITNSTPERRMIFEVCVGSALAYFCFGHQIVYLILQAVFSVIILHIVPYHIGCYANFVYSVLFLSIFHILRQYYDYGGYTMDITGPLMVQTQKLSSLGFNLSDATKKDDKDAPKHQLAHAVDDFPTSLELFSYLFFYHGIVVGPFVFFSDYKEFIYGIKDNRSQEYLPPNILFPQKLIISHLRNTCIFGLIYFFLAGSFSFSYFKNDDFFQSSYFYKISYLFAACTIARAKYYFAWEFCYVINLNSGFGYDGVDENNQPKYNISKNCDALKIELGVNSKVIIDNWNISSGQWLRECVYDRAPKKYNTLLVFLCSAFWHGFYPGYYCFFIIASAVTLIGRLCRKVIRPYTQFNEFSKFMYDLATWFATFFALNSGAVSFSLLDFASTLVFWRNMYYSIHIAFILLYLFAKAVENFQ